MVSVKQRFTAEQLWELPEIAGKRYELIHGELVEVPGAGAVHGLIVGVIYRLLAAFAGEHKLGHAFGDGVGYILAREPDLVRVPDASVVRHHRVPVDGIPDGFWPLAPDLAVEVVSPNDRAEDLALKVREYLSAGTQLVWVVWPTTRSVTAYRPGDAPQELGPDDSLDGEPVLPSFQVRIRDLFDIS